MSLIKAYQQTTYKLLNGECGFSVRVGQKCIDAVEFLDHHKVDVLFFITAENPESVVQDDAENVRLNQLMLAELMRQKLVAWPAVAAPDCEWLAENGFFVSCCTDQAIKLAVEYRQNAILRVAKNHTPMLIFCRPV